MSNYEDLLGIEKIGCTEYVSPKLFTRTNKYFVNKMIRYGNAILQLNKF